MKNICLILLISTMLFSCSTTEPALDRTIFIPDKDDYRLPAYTEWGYNAFGANYERDYFLASNYIVPCKIMYTNGQLLFSLNGIIRENKEMTLIFSFPIAQIDDYKDLMQLHEKKIDLRSDDCTVKILQDGNETILDIIDGTLYFKRTQLLNVDDEANRVILSGIFELRFLLNLFPASISNGRFDMGITTNVFYSSLD